MDLKIRKAGKKDIARVFSLVLELADYEKKPEQVKINGKQFLSDYLDGDAFDVLVAESNKNIIGFALYYPVYSTWKGKSLFLHEFFVKEKFRRAGVGAKLFERVLVEAKKRKVGRVEWLVYRWNEPAINFYKKYGVKIDYELLRCELERQQLEKMKL